MFSSDELSTWTLTNLAAAQAGTLGEAEFMTFSDGSSLTFAEFDRESRRLGRLMATRGVAQGDRVAVMLQNSKELMLLMLGSLQLGAIFVPLNTELKGDFLRHQLDNSAPKLIFCHSEYLELIEPFKGGRQIVVIGEAGDAAPFANGIVSYQEFLRAHQAAEAALVEPRPQDIAMIMYTSGTTGPAKGALLPHAHILAFMINYTRRLNVSADDRYYLCMPLFHANALFMQALAALAVGATVYAVKRFSASRWLAEVQQSRATLTHLLGAMCDFVYNRPPEGGDQSHRLRAILAVPISKLWGKDFERRFGVKLIQGFATTEVNLVAFSNLDDELEAGCAGPLIDDFYEVAIVDPETDVRLATGEVGEIVVRPRHPGCFMQGYHGMPERTLAAWRNLWFHTGDAGRMDERGRLWFVDRLRDRIRRRGENISAYEIEQTIGRHEAVRECAVIGVSTSDSGGEEEVLAAIVMKAGDCDYAALAEFCVANMPRHAVPRFFVALPDLPQTASGKVQKQILRDMKIEQRAWDRTLQARGA